MAVIITPKRKMGEVLTSLKSGEPILFSFHHGIAKPREKDLPANPRSFADWIDYLNAGGPQAHLLALDRSTHGGNPRAGGSHVGLANRISQKLYSNEKQTLLPNPSSRLKNTR